VGSVGGNRSAGQIRDYLLRQLNDALRRPGRYGGELALRIHVDALGFVDDVGDPVRRWHDALRDSGGANAIGVRGAAADVLPDGCAEYVTASVYAELAYQLGWLRADRLLAPEAYRRLVDGIGEWCREDRTLGDVLAAYGPPSVSIGSTNPYYPKSFVYVAAAAAPVTLHLWNELDPTPGDEIRSAFPEPVLLAYRRGAVSGSGDGRFGDSFGYTPEGAKRKP